MASDEKVDVANGAVAFVVLGEFLEEDGWHPTELKGRYAYRMKFSGDNGDSRVYARILRDKEQLVCYTTTDDRVPKDLFATAAEFVTRLNYGLRVGNFELNYKNGEIRFRNGLNFKDIALTKKLIYNTLIINVITFDVYLPSIRGIIYDNMTPIEAINLIEEEEE